MFPSAEDNFDSFYQLLVALTVFTSRQNLSIVDSFDSSYQLVTTTTAFDSFYQLLGNMLTSLAKKTTLKAFTS